MKVKRHIISIKGALLALLAGWVMLPYGSVAPWAQAIVLISALPIALSVAAFPRTSQKKHFWISATPVVLLAIVLAHHYASTLSAPADQTHFKLKLSLWIALGITAWAAKEICSFKRGIWPLLTGISIAGFLQASLGILGVTGSLNAYAEFAGGGRAIGTFSGSNSFGGFVAITLLVTVGLATATLPTCIKHIQKHYKRILHNTSLADLRALLPLAVIIPLSVILLGLLLSGSRGAGLAGGAMAILAIAILLRDILKSKHNSLYTILIFGGVLIAIIALGVGGTYASVGKRFSQLADTTQASLPRTTIWKHTLEMIADNPLGVGLGCFSERFPAYQPPDYGLSRVFHAHNDYLELIAEIGIPGALLLFILILLWTLHVGRYLLQNHKSQTLWLRRGAFLAVITGLLHATVDFNISSRPAVSLLFAILVGVASSRPQIRAKQPQPPDDKEDSATNNTWVLPVLTAGLISLCLIPGIVLHSKYAYASMLIEQGATSLGAPADRYHWLKHAHLPPAKAQQAIHRATQLFPAAPQGHIMLSTAGLLRHKHKQQQLSAQLISRTPGLSEALANHHITISLRQDEIAMLRQANEQIETALKLNPKGVNENSHAAYIQGHLAQLAPTETLYASHLSDLFRQDDIVKRVAPNDYLAHTLLFRGLLKAACSSFVNTSLDLKHELHQRLITTGKHAMWLSASSMSSVLIGWQIAGIDPSTALASSDFPIDVIWKTYIHCKQINNPDAALRILDKLDQALDTTLQHRSQLKTIDTEKTRRQYRLYSIRERSLWALRQREFDRYINLFSKRAAARYDAVESHLQAHIQSPKNDNSQRKAFLQKEWAEKGLSTIHTLELAKYIDDPNQRIASLTPILFFETKTHMPYQSSTLESIELNQDDRDHIVSVTKDQIATQHRAALYSAQHLAKQNKWKDAKEEWEKALRVTNRDPDIQTWGLEHSQQLNLTTEQRCAYKQDLKALLPEIYIGMQFFGGRAELTGCTLRGDKISLFWRFRGEVPVDLLSRLTLRNHDGKATYSKSYHFSYEFPLDYGNGTPRLGHMFQQEFRLSNRIKRGYTLQIGLQRKSERRWIYSTEALPFCEVYDWQQLLPPPSSTVSNTNASSKSILLTGSGSSLVAKVQTMLPEWLITSNTQTNTALTIHTHLIPPENSSSPTIQVELGDPHQYPLYRLFNTSGFAMQHTRTSIKLAARHEQGLLNGIGHALRHMGITSYLPTPEFHNIEHHPGTHNCTTPYELHIPDIALRYMGHLSRGDLGGNWGLRNGLTDTRYVDRINGSHNLHRIVSQHQQFYPLLKGKPQLTPGPVTWQPCLSATGLVEHATAAATYFFAQYPTKTAFSLGINDGEDWCECDACLKLLPSDQQTLPASDRWWSVPYWTFVNAVAANLAKSHPDKRVGALAYTNVEAPPPFRLMSNVSVLLCDDAGSHFDPKQRTLSLQRMDVWTQRCSQVTRYGYAGLASWIFPRYCRDEMAADIRNATDHGIRRFYLETRWVKWIDGPLPWIIAQLLQDPSQNEKELQKEFCLNSFGPAGATMNNYFDYLQHVWSSAPSGKWFDGLYQIEEQAKRYPHGVRKQMTELITQAKQEANDDPIIQDRINTITDPLEVAFAFALEADCMRELRQQITSPSDIEHRKQLLRQLNSATHTRIELLANLPQHTWGTDITWALQASQKKSTLERWNRTQSQLISDIEQELHTLETVLDTIKNESVLNALFKISQ